jgi:hypothetical protein
VSKFRLEAFTDGVIAILITIMVLELHTPAGTSWHALAHEQMQFCIKGTLRCSVGARRIHAVDGTPVGAAQTRTSMLSR